MHTRTLARGGSSRNGAWRFAALLLGVAAGVGLAADAPAASYGTFVGDGITFEDVQDDSGLYGTPTLSGNSLDFSPNVFEAGCPSGCPATTSDRLSFVVQSNHGGGLTNIRLSESGDTILASVTGALASTRVTGLVGIQILEIDGISVAPIESQTEMVFTQGGQFETRSRGTTSLIWEGLVDVDLDALLEQAGEPGRATRVAVTLDNELLAMAESGAVSRIELKDLDGLGVAVNAIPEPRAALLFALAIGIVSSVRGAGGRGAGAGRSSA